MQYSLKKIKGIFRKPTGVFAKDLNEFCKSVLKEINKELSQVNQITEQIKTIKTQISKNLKEENLELKFKLQELKNSFDGCKDVALSKAIRIFGNEQDQCLIADLKIIGVKNLIKLNALNSEIRLRGLEPVPPNKIREYVNEMENELLDKESSFSINHREMIYELKAYETKLIKAKKELKNYSLLLKKLAQLKKMTPEKIKKHDLTRDELSHNIKLTESKLKNIQSKLIKKYGIKNMSDYNEKVINHKKNRKKIDILIKTHQENTLKEEENIKMMKEIIEDVEGRNVRFLKGSDLDRTREKDDVSMGDEQGENSTDE